MAAARKCCVYEGIHPYTKKPTALPRTIPIVENTKKYKPICPIQTVTIRLTASALMIATGCVGGRCSEP